MDYVLFAATSRQRGCIKLQIPAGKLSPPDHACYWVLEGATDSRGNGTCVNTVRGIVICLPS